jgi:hypothetical protein
LPFPDQVYVCIDYPDYEPFAYTAPLGDSVASRDHVLKIYVKPRERETQRARRLP